ncbi:phospholipid carrier-dependent glycosyltransferase, partial [candidate division KSB1 bacterium]|nr:phospholipid carrier-dependent glycosyltransferase [candidate division KSB1 bacterium]NIS24351.1 phospholipid carrier-dependent glycosyltransferase [candidate division KSB1 bacterium]NIT71283.1 phospholipid carrier-dependent glycosyltransferase [candidate division KSB1 bacterium]NIX70963.1 phospholipid carrier-dependent glycosyltransferase [candidate division KSB1 bacterium]
MQSIGALLSLLMPAFSAMMIGRRLGSWENQATNFLVRLVVYVLLVLLPVQLVATLQLLGIFEAFSLFHIAIFDVLVLLSLFLWHRLKPVTTDPRAEKFSLIAFVKTLPTSVLLSFGIVVGCYSVFAIDLFTSYPQGADGIYYRLPLAVRWLQEGSLSIPPKTWRYALPGNAEIPMMILLGVGWQGLALLFNLLGTLILICSVYLIALKCGASRAAAFISALIMASVPLINFQSFLAYTEVYGSSFIMAAIALFLYRHDMLKTGKSNRFLSSIVLSGLAMGIAIGTKVAFLVYGGVFFVTVFVALLLERNGHGRSLKFLTAMVLVAMLVPSIFWFGRAFFTTGNPFYPTKVEMFGRTIFDGFTIEFMRPKAQYHDFVDSRIEWPLYPWTEKNARQFNYSERGGLGASFAAFVPLGVLYALYSSFRSRGQNSDTLKKVFLSFLFLGLPIWFFVLGEVPRYGIPLMAFTVILSVPLIDLLLKLHPRFLGLLLIATFATTSIISAFIPLRSLLGRVYRGEKTRAEIYHYPPVIDELPKGSILMNLGRLHLNNFALAGKRLSNKVIPIFLLPYYRTKGGYLDISEITNEFLQQKNVDYISQIKGDHLLEEGKNDDNPYPKYLASGIALKLVYNGAWNGSTTENPWRVWKVIREPKSTFINKHPRLG